MMAGSGKKLVSYGCFGCLGVIGLCIVVGVVIFAVAWRGAQSQEIEDRTITQNLPSVAQTVTETPEPSAKPTTSSERSAPEAADTRPRPPEGRVVLDLADGEFEVFPGKAGEPIRVEARFDTNSYALEEELEAGAEGEPWLSRVSFERTGSMGLITALKQMISGTSPRVQVWLPPDVPIDLELRVSRGGAQVELGGLWLGEVDLDFHQGGAELEVSQPLRTPVERLTIEASMGGVELGELGNASPRLLDIDFAMGGVDIDLEGNWRCDADITIRGRMGGGTVMLPDGVTVAGVPGSPLRQPAGEELPGPTLRFSTEADMGEIEFIR